jgi:hypothetical protein
MVDGVMFKLPVMSHALIYGGKMLFCITVLGKKCLSLSKLISMYNGGVLNNIIFV